MQQSLIPRDSHVFCQWEFHFHGITAYRFFMTGTGEGQTF